MSSSSHQSSQSEDASAAIFNPEGTHHLQPINLPTSSAQPEPSKTSFLLLSKDIPLNFANKASVRLFLPRHQLLLLGFDSKKKLPLIFYYHGGGFDHFSATTTLFHNFCPNMTLQLQAIIVSVEYRLAQEHHLLAAYDDALEAMHWIRTTQEERFAEFADFSNCFLLGTSSGSNIAYHAALVHGCTTTTTTEGSEPLKIRGVLLHHPFFGGIERTGSEPRMENDPLLPLPVSDDLWNSSLRLGANRDNEYCNPMASSGPDSWVLIQALGCRVLVEACYGVPFTDRQMELVKMLGGNVIETVTHRGEDTDGLEIGDLSKAQDLFMVLLHIRLRTTNKTLCRWFLLNSHK